LFNGFSRYLKAIGREAGKLEGKEVKMHLKIGNFQTSRRPNLKHLFMTV
jgi:hypothetical protein